MDSIRIVKIKKKHMYFWLMMALVCFFVSLRNILEINIPLVLFPVLGLCICMLCDREEIIAFMCSMAPFEMTFQYRYMIIIGAFFLLLKSRKYRFRNIIPIIFMMFWEMMHFVKSGIGMASFFREFAVLLSIGVVLLIDPIDDKDGLTIRSLALMTVFSCIVTVFVNQRLTNYSITSGERLGNTYELAESFNGLLNPNTGSFLCVLCICGYSLLWRKKTIKQSDVAVVLCLSVFVLLFQSKSALASLLIVIIVINYANHRNWIIPTLKILSGFFITLLFGFLFFRGPILGLLKRFMVADLSTGRSGNFIFYHRFIFSNIKVFMFGIGLFQYTKRIMDILTPALIASSGAVTYVKDNMVLVMSHNNIQEVVVSWGIIGVGLLVWLLMTIIYHKRLKRCTVNYLSFLFVLIYTLQGQLISSNIALVSLIFAIVCLEYNVNDYVYDYLLFRGK